MSVVYFRTLIKKKYVSLPPKVQTARQTLTSGILRNCKAFAGQRQTTWLEIKMGENTANSLYATGYKSKI